MTIVVLDSYMQQCILFHRRKRNSGQIASHSIENSLTQCLNSFSTPHNQIVGSWGVMGPLKKKKLAPESLSGFLKSHRTLSSLTLHTVSFFEMNLCNPKKERLSLKMTILVF